MFQPEGGMGRSAVVVGDDDLQPGFAGGLFDFGETDLDALFFGEGIAAAGAKQRYKQDGNDCMRCPYLPNAMKRPCDPERLLRG
jgi:hypothetical protein